MGRIDHHVTYLMEEQEELDEAYEPLFESLLDRAQDFDETDMADFMKLGRLRRLPTLNIATIMSLLYLRMCLWVMMDGAELEMQLEPSRAIERLRSISEGLAGPSSSQVKRLREALERVIGTPVDDYTRHSRAITFALASVDGDVARIFGGAIRVRSLQPGRKQSSSSQPHSSPFAAVLGYIFGIFGGSSNVGNI